MNTWKEAYILIFISIINCSLCIDCYSPLGQFAGQILPSSFSCVGASFYLPNTNNICCSYETVPAPTNIKNISHDTGVSIIRELSKYQQNIGDIPPKLVGYDASWR